MIACLAIAFKGSAWPIDSMAPQVMPHWFHPTNGFSLFSALMKRFSYSTESNCPPRNTGHTTAASSPPPAPKDKVGLLRLPHHHHHHLLRGAFPRPSLSSRTWSSCSQLFKTNRHTVISFYFCQKSCAGFVKTKGRSSNQGWTGSLQRVSIFQWFINKSREFR